MSIFTKIIGKNQDDNLIRNTKGFCIGVAEAEAEATTSAIKLDSFFEDYLSVLEQLNNEKFIVLGRKGTGKSAIGEYILMQARQEPNLFCDFIKKNDIDIEKIVQIGKEEGVTIERALLYKWIILIKFITLFADNQSVACQKGMKYLSDFIKRNRGFININNYEVKEIIHQYGLNVNIEYFKRYLTANGEISKQYRSEKAEFYKLIPDLEKVVVNILKQDDANSYILMFDDLDIGLNINNQESVDTLSDLIRIVKYFNNDLFARNNIDAKIIIFLRTDIQKHLIYSADMPKIFSTYSVELRWYEDIFRNDETKLLLRKFINKRIEINFEEKGYSISDEKDPWKSFVDESSFYGDKTGFKHIIDHTFFRPRDLLLFFKDISSMELILPISSSDINTLLMDKYVMNMVSDIKGELSVNYSSKEIEQIFYALRECLGKDRDPFTYEKLYEELEKSGFENNIQVIIEDIFDYSLIGNYNAVGNVNFKYRESNGRTVIMNREEKFILHYVLQVFFRRDNA